ncbi:MAG: alpha/beta fold hydrolase BchO [Myxococcota bacterium]
MAVGTDGWAPIVGDDYPDWEIDGVDWPHRDWSRFMQVGGVRWHVQTGGSGPNLVLVHGTGAATHSWRDLMPELAKDFRVWAMDLPGHGFTSPLPRSRMGLGGMASAVAGLLQHLNVRPEVVVGHSAGAAILCRMVLDDRLRPDLLVGLNAALTPFGGAAARLFSPAARVMARTPLPRLVAWRARDPASIERLTTGTGSRIDARGLRLYQRLTQRSGHVAQALVMMAQWDLEGLHRELPAVDIPVLLIAGEQDQAVPPVQAVRVAAQLPRARSVVLEGLGHLAHEEAPAGTARRIRAERDRVVANPSLA